MRVWKQSAILKNPNGKPREQKGGRPKTILTEQQKTIAISYVKGSGLFKIRLANLLGIDRKTLDRIFKQDNAFFSSLKRAEAIFVGNLVAKAKPEFILRTRFRDEFPDPPRSRKGYATQERNEGLEKFLDEWESSQIKEGKIVE